MLGTPHFGGFERLLNNDTRMYLESHWEEGLLPLADPLTAAR